MLVLKDIKKKYVTGELVQQALDGVSLSLRDSEFVAILGPSGSGKTTLLNVIGGLDRYDSGDLIINNRSTKKYKDRDWDSYRNHTIGFVFQSYNLIPHQSILANVELALTISGVRRADRRKRAAEALEKVGLGDQLHKRPNQLSGGQMQRVAIARALVNDPDILLADEPTGALDSKTSVQVMELLKEVANDRLVVMVTHNEEIANDYANRIVKIRDGRIVDDSNPYEPETKEEVKEEKTVKTKMSFLTSLALSFNNLRTKKGRTALISFAGSIGIIGIALIMSLSNGVDVYINNMQRNTMLSYPIQIDSNAIDLASIISTAQEMRGESETKHDMNSVYSNISDLKVQSVTMSSYVSNNLKEFKKYLDDESSEIRKYVGENGIVYTYDTEYDIFAYDSEGFLVNTDGSNLLENRKNNNQFPMMRSGTFTQLLQGKDGKLVSKAVENNYDIIYGSWPKEYNEVVLIVNSNNEISSTTLYKLGLMPVSEYREIMAKIQEGEKVEFSQTSLDYEDICSQTFRLLTESDYYVKNSSGLYEKTEDVESIIESALELKISGIVRLKEDAMYNGIGGNVAYTQALTDWIIDHTDESGVVTEQRANPDKNVLTGLQFAPADDESKIKDTKLYFASMGITDKAKAYERILKFYAAQYGIDLTDRLATMSENEKATALDMMMFTAKDEQLIGVYDEFISTGSYEDNMELFGVIDLDVPKSIAIYSDTFENKDKITSCIEKYNKEKDEEFKITYTDYVGLLMSSITTIVNVISYVLMAFVGVSLIVSSIMIGIITYISVLERTKEIGILRSIGASKANISQVFNAETFIIGLLSGLIGIGVSILLIIPGNAVLHAVTSYKDVSAILPVGGAIGLVILSVILTLIGGIIPSRIAAKKDPVIALRTE